MEKQEGGERHVSSTHSLTEFWGTGQLLFHLPCWTPVILPAPWLNLKRVKREIDCKSISSMSKEYIPLYDHVYLQMELKCRLIHLSTVLPPKLKELMVKN